MYILDKSEIYIPGTWYINQEHHGQCIIGLPHGLLDWTQFNRFGPITAKGGGMLKFLICALSILGSVQAYSISPLRASYVSSSLSRMPKARNVRSSLWSMQDVKDLTGDRFEDDDKVSIVSILSLTESLLVDRASVFEVVHGLMISSAAAAWRPVRQVRCSLYKEWQGIYMTQFSKI